MEELSSMRELQGVPPKMSAYGAKGDAGFTARRATLSAACEVTFEKSNT
jgi:hypothetical protein